MSNDIIDLTPWVQCHDDDDMEIIEEIQLNWDDEETHLLMTATPLQTTSQSQSIGLLCTAISALLFSLMSVFVKLAGDSMPSTQIVFVRSIVQASLGIITCLCLRIEPYGPPTVNRLYLLARGSLGAFSLGTYFFTIINMPLGDGTTLFFTGPAMTAVLASLVLKEPFNKLDGFSLVACLLGVVLISRPAFIFGNSTSNIVYKYPLWIPSLAALSGAFTSACAYLIVRIVGKNVHFMVHVTYFGVTSSIVSCILLFAWETPVPISSLNVIDWVYLMTLSLTAFLAQCFLNKGIQLAHAGPASLMRNLDIVFAFIYGLTLFGEEFHWMSILGASLIVLTTGSVAMLKYRESRK